ncbi:MAG: C-GCAxxG-C-C family protein [Spirochaetales bacterium]|uniref:C-GCAxxG-C-C family protein n=1 Tax=Candidatus Thalassospirochaeta sargassi TaxID=3119039 RepID=A0AAJ1MIW5_9SPIO|nr:C-GCAxxG-C-C family protein [Spirochaetales bacterium]
MTRKEIALETFMKGRDCDKAVFSAFEKDVIINPKEDKYIHNCEFPGLPHTKCGAVSGAGCVIFHYKENVGHENTAEEMWQRFKDEFQKRYSALNCSELLGYDLSVRKDAMDAMEAEAIKKTCPQYIEDAVSILEDVIGLSDEI